MVGVKHRFGIANIDVKLFKKFSVTYNAVCDRKVEMVNYGGA